MSAVFPHLILLPLPSNIKLKSNLQHQVTNSCTVLYINKSESCLPKWAYFCMFSSPYIRKTCITWEQYSSIVSVWVYVRRKVCVCVGSVKKSYVREREGKVHTVHTITELECWPLLLSSTFTVPVDMNHYQQRNCTYTPSPPAHPPLHIQQEHTGLLKYHSMSYIHLQL